MTTKINYQALREAAEKALHGEWGYEAGAIWNTCDSGYVQHMAAVEAGDEVSDEEHMSNMRFITLATPTVVLGLLDELSESKSTEVNESSCANSVIDIAINWQMRAKDAEAKLEAAEKRIAELESNEVREVGNQFLVVRHPGKTPVIKHCTGDLEEFLRKLIEQDPLVTIDIITHRYYGIGGQWVQDAVEYLHMMSDAGIRIKGE